MERLESGDDYDRKIQRNIARCSYFIPVVSATTQRRHEGYFRREWSYAIDRARNMADGALFVLPVTHRRHRRRRSAGARPLQGAAFHAAAGRRGDARVRAAPAGLHAARGSHERASRRRRVPTARRRPASLARPRLVHRGDARLLLRPRRGSRRARAPRAAQAPHRAVRPVGPRQDLDPARRARAAPAAARATARSTCASTTPPTRRSPASRSSRRSSRDRSHSGEWTQAGVATAGESLWEFLHHRDDVLRDAVGQARSSRC